MLGLACGLSLIGGSIAQVNQLPNCRSGALAAIKVCDTSLSPSARAQALVSALQSSEKIKNLMSKAQGASRIGLPAYNWWSEALHGVGEAPGTKFNAPYSSATQFPMPVLMAAAFDDDLIHEVGNVIGIEGRAFGNSGNSAMDFWTPDINPFRDPRWGRGSETPGEDVLRIKRYTRAFVRGLEGNQTERRIVATCKHYVGYDLESWNGNSRYSFNARVSMQDLAEYYMQPFQECARDAKAGSIMCSYNAVNGVPACASSYLMNTILRQHWNWTDSNNYIVSDCEAVGYVSNNHKYAKSNAEGTAMCFNAGMDNSCEYSGSSDIPGAWSQKLLNESTVDRALLRLYEGLVRVGYFDGDKAQYKSLDSSALNSKSAQALALQAAVDSIVMTKNERDTLPFALKSGSSLAMIGFWADTGSDLLGGYSGKSPYLHTPVSAAKLAGYTVNYATGPRMQASGDTWTSAAVAAAEKSDFVVFFGGIDTSSVAEGRDRTSVAFPGAQLALIQKLAAVGKPMAVVLMGDMLDNTPLLTLAGVGSVLWAGWPGQDGGTAVVKLISGASAPAGRLPLTQYPANYTSAVPMTNMALRPGSGNPGRTYRWYPTPVQSFGTGLHYTTFNATFGDAVAGGNPTWNIQTLLSGCKNAYPDTCPLPALPVRVVNSGKVTSDFVALVFVASQAGPTPYPIKTLVNYGRLKAIAAGATATAEFPWTFASLARHNDKGDAILYPGTYTLMLDQPTQTTATLTLTGSEATLDKWPQQ